MTTPLQTTAHGTGIFQQMGVLAEPTRGRLLLLLEQHELAVSELCAILQQPQSTISRHLKVLADGGWVSSRRDGTSRLYSMSADRPAGSGDGGAREGGGDGLWQLVRGELDGLSAAEQDRVRLSSVLAERRNRSREFFSSTAGEWDRLRRELFGERGKLAPLLGLLDPRWTVGDLGCGTGQTAAALAPFVSRVMAVDESPKMLAAAARHCAGHDNVLLRRGSLEELPMEDAALDAAVLTLVLHHVADPPVALVEVGRALAPGGRLLLVDMLPHDRESYRRKMGHLWLGFAGEQIGEWLAAAGFGAPRIVPLPPDPEAKGPNLFAATATRKAGG